MVSFLRRGAGCRVVDDICAEGLCDACDSAADGAKAEDAPCLPFQFAEGGVKQGEKAGSGITSVFYIFIIVGQVLHQIEQHGKCVLRHGFCGITRHVAPFDPAACQVFFVQVVGPGGGDAYQLQVLCAADVVDRDFIDHHYVRVRDAGRDFLRGGCGISYNFSELLEFRIVCVAAERCGV